MKKKSLVTRVLALAVSSAMLVGEASTVSASELSTDAASSANVEATSEETTTDTSSVAEATDSAESTESTEATEATEASIDLIEADTDDSLVGAFNGDVSKVIGIDARASKNTSNYKTDSDNNKKYYYYVTDHDDLTDGSYIYASGVFGASCLDADTGLYKYNNKYYSWCSTTSSGTYFSYSGEVEVYKTYSASDTALFSEIESCYDSQKGLYIYNGKMYSSYYHRSNADNTKVTYYFYDRVSSYAVVNATTFEGAKKQCLNPDGTGTYIVGNKCFTSVSGGSIGNNSYVVEGKAYNEIAFGDSYSVSFSWNPLSSKEVNTTSDGKKIYIGYQVKVNDKEVSDYAIAKDASGNTIGIQSDAYRYIKAALAGETYKIDVRGVYYTKTETKDAKDNTLTSFNVYKTGDWSSYTYTTKVDEATEIPAITSLKATDNGTTIDVTFDAAPQVKVYVTEYSFENELTAEQSSTDKNVRAAFSSATNKASRTNYLDYGVSKTTFTKNDTRYNKYKYHYYIAWQAGVEGNYKLSDNRYSNVASAVYTAQTGTPDITNFRVVNSRDGGYTIKWDVQDSDADVYVYRYTSANFPADYTYLSDSSEDAYNASTDGSSTKRYANTFDNDKNAALSKVECAKASLSDGQISSSSFCNTEIGRTYYFVAMTVDTYDYSTAKTTPLNLGGVDYYYYNYVGNPTAVISATNSLGKPEVDTTVTKNSVKLTMQDDDSATGYVIYKKNSKGKYKKLTSTTDNNYTDTDLKTNKTYSYRVYEYYYNDETGNNQVSSQYTTVSATTNKVSNFEVKTKMTSSKKVKISWTKVKKATKYQIYRITANGDTTINPKTGYATNVKLIKTIKKASKTSFTDKVNSGEKYTYRVVATYKSNKKKVQVQGESTIAMELQTPVISKTSVSGNTVSFKWATDKFASGYEVKYMVYDADYNRTTNQYCYDKTANNSYSIAVPKFGYVKVSIRAYDANVYSDYSNEVSILNDDEMVSGVNASCNQSTGAVDISWNASASAAYYYVYYTTKKPMYDEATGYYIYNQSAKAVTKESNNDESNYYNEVYYDEYNKYDMSIAGTSTSDNSQLKVGVTYYYFVVGYNASGSQVTYPSAPATVTYGVEKPSITSIKNKKSKKVKLKFTAVASASGSTKYIIYRATKKNGTYKKVGSTKKLSYTDKKLKKGKTYYYKVVATGKSALNSDFSVTSSVKKVKIKK